MLYFRTGHYNFHIKLFLFNFPFLLPTKVIVEKAPKARIGDLDKKKYLVPSDLTGKRNITLSGI